jgi:hypothetical protein
MHGGQDDSGVAYVGHAFSSFHGHGFTDGGGLAFPSEAARQLARFTEEIRMVRPPPLITSPPKQPPPKQLVPKRSGRIAAQQMDHIPASKRSEVLLMRKMGFLEPSASPSSAAKDSYESFEVGISAADAEAFDLLFLVCRGWSDGRFLG